MIAQLHLMWALWMRISIYSHAHKTIIGHAIAKIHITSGQHVKTQMLTVNIMTISLFKYNNCTL